MEEREKKIVLFTFQLIMFLISIALIVLGILMSLGKIEVGNSTTGVILGVVGGAISPSNVIGIWIKLFINKKHLKNIDNKLIESGIKVSKTKKEVIEAPKIEVEETLDIKVRGNKGY